MDAAQDRRGGGEGREEDEGKTTFDSFSHSNISLLSDRIMTKIILASLTFEACKSSYSIKNIFFYLRHFAHRQTVSTNLKME
jgi:hypothetical protein